MNRKLEKGFSLLEVMIALLVISVGALGLTKAQIAALQAVSDAGLRTTASILVQDMAARIQANAREAFSGNNTGNPKGSGYCLNATYKCSNTTSPVNNPNCLSSGQMCWGYEMALQDVYEWTHLILFNFPTNSNPQSSISATSSAVYTITIYWQSWQSRLSGTTCSISNGVSSNCDQSVTATVTPPLINAGRSFGGGLLP